MTDFSQQNSGEGHVAATASESGALRATPAAGREPDGNAGSSPDSEGVLIGATVLHKPSAWEGLPSHEPGYGSLSRSRCGRFSGIVYERSWVKQHWPELPDCGQCHGR